MDKALAEAVAAGAKLIKAGGQDLLGRLLRLLRRPRRPLVGGRHNPYFTLGADGRVALDM